MPIQGIYEYVVSKASKRKHLIVKEKIKLFGFCEKENVSARADVFVTFGIEITQAKD